jgi:uncharacterized protein (TIGR02246 family)
MRFAALPLLILASLPSCASNDLETALGTAKAKTSLDSLWTAYAVASDQRDPIAFEALFTEDAVLVFSGVPTARGRRAIGECLASLYSGVDATGLRVVPEEMEVSGDLAAQSGAFEESFTKGETPRTRFGRFVLIAERDEDMRWRIQLLVALADSTGA